MQAESLAKTTIASEFKKETTKMNEVQSSREIFELEATKLGFNTRVRSTTGAYESIHTDIGWHFWQASHQLIVAPLVSEMNYIASISNGQVQRVALNASKKVNMGEYAHDAMRREIKARHGFDIGVYTDATTSKHIVPVQRVTCPHCKKRPKTSGLAQHISDSHPELKKR